MFHHPLALGTILLCSCLPLTAAAADPASDPARGPVDPYDAGDERRRFLAAAGVDGELDEREFKANLTADQPFVRKFDAWATLRAFDKNNNQSLDWFEADGYRQSLRDAVLLAHDRNKDSRLTDGERDAANEQLAAGRTPRLTLPAGAAPIGGGAGGWAQGTAQDWDTNGDGKMDEAEREAYTRRVREQQAKYWADYTAKWDEDGDGQLSPAEHEKARKAQYEEWKQKNPEQAARYEEQQAAWKKQQEEQLRRWDADGDGHLNREEAAAAQAHAMREWREKNPEAAARWDEQQAKFKQQQAEHLRRWDADGDGVLNNDEQRAAADHARAEGRRRYEEYIRKWDADGDGKLSPEESQTASAAAMREWREKNPEQAAQWDKQQAQWKQQQQERLDKYDTNRDGRIDADEWRKAQEEGK